MQAYISILLTFSGAYHHVESGCWSMWLLTQVTQVAPGGMHSVALTPDGEVYTTGVNDEGALGRESGMHCSFHLKLPCAQSCGSSV